MRFRKKKQSEPGYEVKNLGAFIVERVQMPHSLTTLDGSEYKILTWDYRLTVEDGPMFFERSYATGTPESLAKMRSYIRDYTDVDSELEARHLFYRELYLSFGGKE